MEIKDGINYKNDNGEIVSKEEFELLWKNFQIDVDNAYNEKANEILTMINNNSTSDLEKLWMLFDYLTSENMIYDLQATTPDGKMAVHHGYTFSPYVSWKIEQGSKYPVLLNNSGVCITYSLAFEDLANKLGIPCRVVSGNTGMEHAWNVVLINNEIKYVDVSYAIMNRKINNKKDFFLKDSFPNRSVTSSLTDIEQSMREQYIKEHPHISIKQVNERPTIEIISRSDNNEDEPKITIQKK